MLGKHTLAAVHRCERHFLAEEAEGFAWSPATAQGVVAHKAVELRIQATRPVDPGEVVAMALDRLRDDRRGPAQWLDVADEAERAELSAKAIDAVTKFDDTFPPIPTRWRPRVESRLRAHLADDRVELSGKVDLALGRASGSQARVLIVDLKTGRPAASHAADLRFYALLETLRVGVPPFRLASLYLDSGHWRQEDVDEELLWLTARRVGDALGALAGLRLGGRLPTETPGPTCSWCPVRDACEPGRAWAPPDDGERWPEVVTSGDDPSDPDGDD